MDTYSNGLKTSISNALISCIKVFYKGKFDEIITTDDASNNKIDPQAIF